MNAIIDPPDNNREISYPNAPTDPFVFIQTEQYLENRVIERALEGALIRPIILRNAVRQQIEHRVITMEDFGVMIHSGMLREMARQSFVDYTQNLPPLLYGP